MRLLTRHPVDTHTYTEKINGGGKFQFELHAPVAYQSILSKMCREDLIDWIYIISIIKENF